MNNEAKPIITYMYIVIKVSCREYELLKRFSFQKNSKQTKNENVAFKTNNQRRYIRYNMCGKKNNIICNYYRGSTIT